MMTKKQDRRLLYEMIKKDREKVSFFDKLKRVKFVKSRAMRSEPGHNPFDKEKQDEVPEKGHEPATVSDTESQEVAKRESFFKAPVSKRVRRVSKSNTYYKWTVFSVLAGLIIIMLIVKISGRNESQKVSVDRADSLVEENRNIGGEEGFEPVSDSSRPIYRESTVSEIAAEPVQRNVPERSTAFEEQKDEQNVLTSSIGDHIVVIVQYFKQEDLIPVKKYFANNGIDTKIVKRGSNYFLITANRYLSPYKTGSNSKEVMKRIKEVGGKYEAPAGYEPFAQTPFQDAYWMNVSELQ